MDPISALFMIPGLTFIGIGVPLIQRRVPPDRWYGLRVRKTMTNPSVWCMMGYDLVWAGAAVAATALVTGLVQTRVIEPVTIAMNVTVFAVVMVALALQVFAALKRL